jgi:hypothetical protein
LDFSIVRYSRDYTTGRWKSKKKKKKTVIVCVIHHRQNPSESTQTARVLTIRPCSFGARNVTNIILK